MTIGAGSSASLSNALVDLGCSDLVVTGTMNAGSAAVAQAVDVTIGGTLNGGSAHIDVTGNWSRTGTFNPPNSVARCLRGHSPTPVEFR